MKFAAETNQGFDLVDFFTPGDWQTLDTRDQDFGSTGTLLVPGSPLAASGDKAGTLYFANTDHLGGLGADRNTFGELNMGTGTAFFSAPVYYAGEIYAWAQSDVLKAYLLGDALQSQVKGPISQATSTQPIYMPGGALSVSANGAKAGTAILWATVAQDGSASGTVRPGQVFAFDAGTLGQLWSSADNASRDNPGNFGKFCPPTVANGKVYIGTFSNQVVVYGLLN